MVMRGVAVTALLFAAASALGTQQPTERVRTGPASVAGRITEAETKRPLSGVLVTLVAGPPHGTTDDGAVECRRRLQHQSGGRGLVSDQRDLE